MRGEVIAIGDELSSGQRLDTNSQWLSRHLSDLGIQVIRHTTIGDDMSVLVNAFRRAASEVDLVLVTGGLGPTLDDLTRQALAEAADVPLHLEPEQLAKIEQLFARRNRPMPERNRIQAMFPEGAAVIPNPHGSAPGIDICIPDNEQRCRFFALPGVPAEMRQMWFETVAPRIEAFLGNELGALRFHALKAFGIGESDVEVRLPDLIQRDRDPAVGITVSRATITLRMVTRARTEQEFQTRIAATVNEIHEALGDLVFGANEEELEHVVTKQMEERKFRLGTIEIGAGGWLSGWLSQADRRRGTIAGCLNFPDLEAAGKWLGVENEGGFSFKNIAAQIQDRFQCEAALIVGDYPTYQEMADSQQPFPFQFTVRLNEQDWSVTRTMGGHPDVLGPRVAKTGLDLLRRALVGFPLE